MVYALFVVFSFSQNCKCKTVRFFVRGTLFAFLWHPGNGEIGLYPVSDKALGGKSLIFSGV